jgi:hypothetical protein
VFGEENRFSCEFRLLFNSRSLDIGKYPADVLYNLDPLGLVVIADLRRQSV